MTSDPPKKTAWNSRTRRLCAAFAAAAALYTGGHAGAAETSEVCAKNTDDAELSQKLPDLHKTFQRMAHMPLSGKPVFDALKNPVNNLLSCTVPEGGLEKRLGSYDIGSKTLRVDLAKSPKEGPVIAGHESFHAHQHANGAFGHPYGTLTLRDSAVNHMLSEAAAVAYGFVYAKEAEKYNPASYTDFKNSGQAFGMEYFFERDYNQTLKNLKNIDDTTREAKALEAGGRAVVRTLLAGKNEEWLQHYREELIKDTDRKIKFTQGRAYRASSSADNETSLYAHVRRNIYFKSGIVSPGINLIPEEFLGNNSGAASDEVLKNMRLQAVDPAAPPVLSAPKSTP